MRAEVVLEIALYGLLFFLIIILRVRRGSKQSPVALRQVVAPKRPVRAKPVVRQSSRTTEGDRAQSWRRSSSPSGSVPAPRSKPSPPLKVKPVHVEEEKKSVSKPVIDLTRAFEKSVLKPPAVSVRPPPPPPPPSPVNEDESCYGLDPSFNEYMEYEGFQFVSDPAETRDADFERRRAYLKRSVTDGEVMMEIGDFRVCQIFVFGIEYHYVSHKKSGVTAWDLPCELEEECSSWFLPIPQSRRRKMTTPPTPLSLETPTVPL